MTARYRVRHRSHYSYDHPVVASFNEARLTPCASRWQQRLESVLRVEQASWQHRYVDYWGTQVQVFEANQPHRELVVEANSLVEVEPALRPTPQPGMGWDALSTHDVLVELSEYLSQLPTTQPPEDLADLAEALAAGRSPNDAAHEISGAVYDAMTYQPGSTGVHTLGSEAWAERSGVCQDYAHLVVGALRHIGIPARYVSGYLHPHKKPVLGEPAVGQSHAWVEWWLGEWMPHDPTNNETVTDRHVTIGTGRAYGDVPPIKGIVAGSPVRTQLQVEVEITRLA